MWMIRKNLKRARESEPSSRESYQYDSWNLGTIKGMVSYWADLHDRNGEPLNGHQRNNWAKDVLRRIIELDEMFKEDDKIREEEK
jgi:hypothetical protein